MQELAVVEELTREATTCACAPVPLHLREVADTCEATYARCAWPPPPDAPERRRLAGKERDGAQWLSEMALAACLGRDRGGRERD